MAPIKNNQTPLPQFSFKKQNKTKHTNEHKEMCLVLSPGMQGSPRCDSSESSVDFSPVSLLETRENFGIEFQPQWEHFDLREHVKRSSREFERRQSQSIQKLISCVWQTIFSIKEVALVQINSGEHLWIIAQQSCTTLSTSAHRRAGQVQKAPPSAVNQVSTGFCQISLRVANPGQYSSALALSSGKEMKTVLLQWNTMGLIWKLPPRAFLSQGALEVWALLCPYGGENLRVERSNACGSTFQSLSEVHCTIWTHTL